MCYFLACNLLVKAGFSAQWRASIAQLFTVFALLLAWAPAGWTCDGWALQLHGSSWHGAEGAEALNGSNPGVGLACELDRYRSIAVGTYHNSYYRQSTYVAYQVRASEGYVVPGVWLGWASGYGEYVDENGGYWRHSGLAGYLTLSLGSEAARLVVGYFPGRAILPSGHDVVLFSSEFRL